jgi:hypothetical protein
VRDAVYTNGPRPLILAHPPLALGAPPPSNILKHTPKRIQFLLFSSFLYLASDISVENNKL